MPLNIIKWDALTLDFNKCVCVCVCVCVVVVVVVVVASHGPCPVYP